MNSQSSFVVIGSDGDVLPTIWLAKAFENPVIYANEYHKELIEHAGMKFLPIGKKSTYIETIMDKNFYTVEHGRRIYLEQMSIEVNNFYDYNASHDTVFAQPFYEIDGANKFYIQPRTLDNIDPQGERALALFPEWFHTKPEPSVVFLDFPDVDTSFYPTIDIEEGTVLVTFGSPCRDSSPFIQEIAKHIDSQEKPVVVVCQDDCVYPELPFDVKRVSSINLDAALPKCKRVFHHGGIGTIAKCFKHGVSQTIMPIAFDQFDNAARANRYLGATVIDCDFSH